MKRALLVFFSVLLAGFPAGASNDTYFPQQWALAKMHVEAAWRASRGSSVVVAVIDTGVDSRHPDLSGRLVPGYDFVDGDSNARDENGHGTHMAGSIAAIAGNGTGIAGIAPEAKIMPVRVLDENGKTEDPQVVADGIRWAADRGARVINLSLAADGPGTPGGGGQDLLGAEQIDIAIRYAALRGAVIVVAAGNSESGGKPRTAYDAPDDIAAIVVGAATREDRRAAYSNYGDGLDVLAPGGGSATEPEFDAGCTSANAVVGLYWNPGSRRSAYAGACGTSVAVAQVSGVAALLLSRGTSSDRVVDRILSTAVDLGPNGWDAETGYGRVDAARALGVSTTVRPTGRAGTSTPPARGGGLGAAASAPASPAPSEPVPSAAAPSSGHPPQAAAEPPEKATAPDRATPIAVAAALLFFTAWGFFAMAGVMRVRD